ncbi:hypothetical protein TNCV_2039311 [Trichonephila clavipes]|nr:hypothetical protein TNCV_2039311 [Trichonephila clavipes]
MYYSIDMIFFYSKDNLVALHFKYDFWHMTATAGSDVVQSGRPIFDDLLLTPEDVFSSVIGELKEENSEFLRKI